MRVRDSREDPGAGVSIVYARNLAFYAVASFAYVFGKVPEGEGGNGSLKMFIKKPHLA